MSDTEKNTTTASLVIGEVVMANPHNPRAWLDAVRAKFEEAKRSRVACLRDLDDPEWGARAREGLAVVERDLLLIPELIEFIEVVIRAQEPRVTIRIPTAEA